MTTQEETQTVTIAEACEMLGIARNTGYSLAEKGELPGARRLGKRWVVSRRVLREFLGLED